jgi:hypothetical protein
MTETLTIDRLVVNSPDDGSDRAVRVNRIARGVAERRLDQSLGLNSLAPEGEWCIQRVGLSAELNFERPDSSLEEALAQAMLGAIAAAVRGPDVVHYPRLADALADLVASAAIGRFDRGWAWSRLGVIDDVEVLERETGPCVLDVLARYPIDALGAVTGAVNTVGLAPLHRLLGQVGWSRLAHIVIGAHVDTSTRIAIDATIGDNAPDLVHTVSEIARASRVIRSSRIAAAARASRLRLEGETARALALLVLAESEPATLHRAGLSALCLTVAKLVAGAVPPVAELSSDAGELPCDRRMVGMDHAHEVPAQEPEGVATEHRGEVTQHAGLMFLLNAAGDASMPESLLDDPALEAMDSAELLGRAALFLVSAADDDPAVLAFVGSDAKRLGSGWSHKAVPLDVLQRIEVHAGAWAVAAAARLSRDDEDPLEVMGELTRRTGRIEREQGWTDVHLDLADVDVDVRLAGLDLDPGWVPWVGSVVRFCYA